MQHTCSCCNRDVLCLDIKFVATNFSCFFAFGKCRDINFFCRNKHFHLQHLYFVTTFFLLFFSNFVMTEFSYVATKILWLLNNLCHDRVFFCRDRHFFSGPYHLLSCLLRHRNLCCDILDLANLSSLSIYVVTEFSSVATKFYHSTAFIVTT